MNYRLKRHNIRLRGEVLLESSKSESNRALIINALAGGDLSNIHNLSQARDTQTMLKLLTEDSSIYDVKDAGTTMRFLTAYLAITGHEKIITGTDRMKKRPIGPLVEALRSLGTKIQYMEKEGYPPLKIEKIQKQLISKISIPGNISSQYISALLMIAPYLENGLEIILTSKVYSEPYIHLTRSLMQAFGVMSEWGGNIIKVPHQSYTPTLYEIEGDWSGASYWYGLVSLSPIGSQLKLPSLRRDSQQGDMTIVSIMNKLGVATQFESDGVLLTKNDTAKRNLVLDFKDCPDLAQTVMVVAAASHVKLRLTGLESLKIKETDRILAMQIELDKLGAQLLEDNGTWQLIPSHQLPESVSISTYNDHRMAMAFVPLCQLTNVIISNPIVVEKSYPGFWRELKKIGIDIISS